MHAWQHAESFGTKYVTFTLPHQGGIGEIKFIYCRGHKAGKYPNFQWFETQLDMNNELFPVATKKEPILDTDWKRKREPTSFP